MGAALVVSMLVALLAGAVLSGRGEQMRELGLAGLLLDRDARTAILFVVLLGYVVTARRYVSIGARRCFDALVPLLSARPGADVARERERVCEAPSDPRRRRRRVALALLIAPLVGFGIDRDPTFYLQRAYWTFEHFAHWGVGLLLCGNLGLLFDASTT
mgnify:CR=1 FL=1